MPAEAVLRDACSVVWVYRPRAMGDRDRIASAGLIAITMTRLCQIELVHANGREFPHEELPAALRHRGEHVGEHADQAIALELSVMNSGASLDRVAAPDLDHSRGTSWRSRSALRRLAGSPSIARPKVADVGNVALVFDTGLRAGAVPAAGRALFRRYGMACTAGSSKHHARVLT
jgi:hypothetical protein